MKLLTTSALALCLLVLVGCAEGTAPTPDATITEATNKIEANVEGMDCTGCSGSIMAAVEGIDGVTACHADVKTGNVQVALADDADADATMLEVEKVIAELQDGKYAVKTITVSYGATEAETTSCPEGCTKDCCKKSEVEDVIETIKEEANDAVKNLEIPSLGGE